MGPWGYEAVPSSPTAQTERRGAEAQRRGDAEPHPPNNEKTHCRKGFIATLDRWSPEIIWVNLGELWAATGIQYLASMGRVGGNS